MGSRSAILTVQLMVLAAGILICGACGDQSAPGARLFAAARVVERLADGSSVPVSGVEVRYEVFGRLRGPANPPLLHSFTSSTDAAGLATISVHLDSKSVDEVNLVFVTAAHSDGRRAFRRVKVINELDFGVWFQDLSDDWDDPGAVAARLCEGAERQRDCETEIADQDLKAWGASVNLRLSPSP